MKVMDQQQSSHFPVIGSLWIDRVKPSLPGVRGKKEEIFAAVLACESTPKSHPQLQTLKGRILVLTARF